MTERVEIKASDHDAPLVIENGLIKFDNDHINLVSKVEDLKIVKYLGWCELETDKWGITLSANQAEQLINIGIELVPHTESPRLNRKKS